MNDDDYYQRKAKKSQELTGAIVGAWVIFLVLLLGSIAADVV